MPPLPPERLSEIPTLQRPRPAYDYETTIERREMETLVRGARELMPTQTFLGCALGARGSMDSVDIPVEHDEEEVLPRSQRPVTGLPPARVEPRRTQPLRRPPRVGPPPLPATLPPPAAPWFPPLAHTVRRGPPPLPYIPPPELAPTQAAPAPLPAPAPAYVPPPVAVTVRPPAVVTVSTRPRRGKKARWVVALIALGLGIGLWLDPSARAQARREGHLVLGALARLVEQPAEPAARVEEPAPVAPEVSLASVSAQPSSVNVEWWATGATIASAPTPSAPAKTVSPAPVQRAPVVATHAATPARAPAPVRVAPPPRPAPPAPAPAPAPKKEAPRAHAAADDGEAVQAAQEARQQLANTF